MALYPSGGQFGGNWTNNPQMKQNRPYKWDPVKKQYVAPTGPAATAGIQGKSNSGGSQMDYWENLLKNSFGQQPQQVSAPNIGGNFQNYLTGATGAIPVQNVTAPTMSNDYLKYLEAGVAPIDVKGMTDVEAVIRASLPGIQEQQDRAFAEAAARAGKTGMWGSPYATALGTASRRSAEDIAKITEEYTFQAAESLAARQLQAEMANRANQLQAAGLSASQAQAQAELEMQGQLANQTANLQAQLAQRSNQLQSAGLSMDAAMKQAQMELQASMANQQAGQTQLSQLLQAYSTIGGQNLGQQQLDQGSLRDMMDRFQGIYGDITSPDDLWKYLTGAAGGQASNLPQLPMSQQQPTTPQFNTPTTYTPIIPTSPSSNKTKPGSTTTQPTISGGRPVGSPGVGMKWAWDGKQWVARKI